MGNAATLDNFTEVCRIATEAGDTAFPLHLKAIRRERKKLDQRRLQVALGSDRPRLCRMQRNTVFQMLAGSITTHSAAERQRCLRLEVAGLVPVGNSELLSVYSPVVAHAQGYHAIPPRRLDSPRDDGDAACAAQFVILSQ